MGVAAGIKRLAVAGLAAGALLAAGCTGPQPAGRTPEPVTSPPASADATGLAAVNLRLEPVASGFDQPLFVTHAGDGSSRLFVVEQSGFVRVIRDGSVQKDPFIDLSDAVSTGGERGLLGLAFAPDYRSSGHFYVDFTDRDGDTVVARFTAADPESDAPALTGPDVLLRVRQPYSNHNGGCIMFGPDGLLWVGMGDGGSGGDPQGNAQNAASLLGKMLTLDVSQPSPKPVTVISGVRNPWRFSFDRDTGELWIGDVGQNAWEEIDRLSPDEWQGANLGWNVWEGSHPFGEENPSKTGFIFPVAEYGHEEGRSVTGGYVYRGSRHTDLDGVYLYADFEAGWIAGLKDAGSRRLVENAGNPSSFGEDEDGELYVVDYGGTVYRIAVTNR